MSEQLAAAEPRVAALDLGSNSFHLLVAGVDEHGWRPQLRLGEKVQLAAGLREGYLSLSAIERGLECLRRFVPHIRHLAPERVRAVGTYTLRVARNRDLFIVPAQRILGHELEIISGEQEAALIYRGVADACGTRPQLVIDIGGGSTELALGQGAAISRLASVPVGCVTYRHHFPQGFLNDEYFEGARRAACESLRRHWQGALPAEVEVVGSSGTLLAVEQVLVQQGWSEGGITREGLALLRAALFAFGRIDEVCFQGLSESRRSLFATGLAIVQALFDSLGLERMTLSQSALREGLVEDLLREPPPPARAFSEPSR